MDLSSGAPAAPCPARDAVEAALADPGAPAHRLLVVPSTAATLAALPRWQQAPQVVAVAPGVAGTLAPTALLARLRPDGAGRPRVALVFSDQLVSPEHAPLLVTHAGRARYVSGLEAVAHVGYGLQVAAWTGAGAPLEPAPPGCDSATVLRLLLRHLAACEALGERWLARAAQAARTPAERTRQARRQLRLFHSAVMYTFRAAPLPAAYRPLVERLDGLQRQLAGAREG